jgi:glucokinase
MLASGHYGLDPLADAVFGREDATGEDVVAAAREGHEGALEAMRVLGERLGVGIANVINTFDPFEVVIGGGASAAGELLLGPARETAAHYTLPGVGTRTVIRLARHGADAGVHGAALMAAHEEEQR